MISKDKIDKAYEDQAKLVSEILSTKTIGGFKAAVSAKEAQKKLGLPTLISGVLFSEGEIKNNATIELASFHQAKIETEIGFILDKDITELTNSESVKNLVSEILPVFEIPNITIPEVGSLPPTDVIANNGFSSHYVVGEKIAKHSINPNTCTAQLYHNDNLINTGNAIEAMGNQWEALSSAINLSIEHGYHPKKGQLIITGALGSILKLQKGNYRADYGELGTLNVNVI